MSLPTGQADKLGQYLGALGSQHPFGVPRGFIFYVTCHLGLASPPDKAPKGRDAKARPEPAQAPASRH